MNQVKFLGVICSVEKGASYSPKQLAGENLLADEHLHFVILVNFQNDQTFSHNFFLTENWGGNILLQPKLCKTLLYYS